MIFITSLLSIPSLFITSSHLSSLHFSSLWSSVVSVVVVYSLSCVVVAQNSPIWVVRAHGRAARKADLDPDVCINEHSQRPPFFIEEGVRIIRMLDDVYLPHCMARLGTDTSSWWWQEDNAPSHTSRRTKAFLKEREVQLLTWPLCSPDLSPLDFPPLARVGNSAWRPSIHVSTGTARHDRAHSGSSRPRSR